MQGGFPRGKEDVHDNPNKFQKGTEYAMSIDTFNSSVSRHCPAQWGPRVQTDIRNTSYLKYVSYVCLIKMPEKRE